ncbi:type II secretion system F family protein, partial [Actinomyces sp. oral taxon 171]
AALAGPRTTARLLACLPVVGLGLGMLVGADPASLLLDGGVGSAVGALGIVLMAVGHLVTRRLIRAATADGDAVDEALVLDLAAAALSAGASVPGVLTALGEALEEEGAGVVGRALLLGAPWEEAWQAPDDEQWRAQRSRLESCLRPGWEDGASPSALLAATAASLRAGRHARDEEAAERLAVRLVLPLGACHLPAFVILGIAPVVASVGMSMLTG